MRLHEQGLIYRGSYLVNWSPSLQTAVSDLEVIALICTASQALSCLWPAQRSHIAQKISNACLQLCQSISISLDVCQQGRFHAGGLH